MWERWWVAWVQMLQRGLGGASDTESGHRSPQARDPRATHARLVAAAGGVGELVGMEYWVVVPGLDEAVLVVLRWTVAVIDITHARLRKTLSVDRKPACSGRSRHAWTNLIALAALWHGRSGVRRSFRVDDSQSRGDDTSGDRASGTGTEGETATEWRRWQVAGDGEQPIFDELLRERGRSVVVRP